METANALIEHDLQNALIAINPMNGTTLNGAALNGAQLNGVALNGVALNGATPTVSAGAASTMTQCLNGTATSHSGSSGRSTPNNTSDPAPGKLFVGGLSWQTSSDKLKEYFGMFGNVTDVLIMKDPVTQV